jgi:hypothetical protein
MGNKAFVGSVSIYNQGNVYPVIEVSSFACLNPQGESIYLNIGAAYANLDYNDDTITAKSKVIQAIREVTGDETIEVFFLDGLSGVLSL